MQKSDVVEVFWDKRRVGRVSQTKTRLCVFEYDTDFIDCGSSVSPLELPLKAGLFTARPDPFLGNFGVFDDSLPDGWGALVLSRYLQKKGRRLSDLTIPQRLALVGSGGRGALEFVPDESVTEDPAFADLQALARESREILNDRSYNGEGIEEFQRRGGSSGGARPKIFLKADGTEWLVKFRAQNDPADVGVCEYQYSLLAKACGVEMPATRLFENRYFAAERFDRRNGKKIHAVSAAGLLCADYRLPSLDYLHLFQLCCFLTHSEEELWKIFRLMTFNFLIDENC